jgi:hypothetical protein
MDMMGANVDVSRTVWRKSSRSSGNGSNCVEVARVSVWRKSSRSGGSGSNCVEVADAGHAISVRDSKDPSGPMLLLAPGDWQAFTTQVKAGHHNLG